MKRYPFKFLDAYTREDSTFFFGRQEEVDALYEMVFQADLLLVHGASGTGKSSLIQCGLASKFQSHDWLALNIRRGNNLNESLEKALQEASGDLNDDTPGPAQDLDWLERDWSAEDADFPQEPRTLSPLARRFRAIYLRHFKPLYLIFDQFEELYILGDADEQNQFIQTVKEILRVEHPVKIILSIREEYLGHLYEFERAVPELLRKKLRVEPMNLDKVKTVILGVGNEKASSVTLKNGEEAEIAEQIFHKIRGEEKILSIPLPYLQVFLDKLYLHISGDHSRQAETEFSLAALGEIGDLGDVLRNFLDEQVLAIANQMPACQPEQLWQALSPFVTLDGTKDPLSAAQLAERLPDVPTELLQKILPALVNSRILRYEERNERYEIAHDTLARQIHARRSDEEIALLEVQRLVKSQANMQESAREPFSEKQLALIEPYVEKLALSEGERGWVRHSREVRKEVKRKIQEEMALALTEAKKRAEKETALRKQAETQKKRTQVRSLIALAMALLASGAAFWAFGLQQQAQKAEEATQTALKKANTLVDAFYFYEGRFALAYGEKDSKNVFYFIDKNGREVKKLGQWEKAEQFEWNGFAKVKKKDGNGVLQDYLLDTLGQPYRVAYSIKDLNENTTALDLSAQYLTKIPDVVFKKVKLRVLLLQNNQLSSLPALVSNLKNLSYLDLSENKLSSLPKELGGLKNLSYLDLSGNGLSSLPKELGGLKNLSYLDLSGNGLSSLPKELGGLKNLSSLNLSFNGLSSLPKELGGLKNLSYLDLSGNGLSSLPKELGGLKNLSELDLSRNGLSSLPKELGGLKNLSSLDLSSNELSSLLKEIGGLKNLSSLNLSFNGLSSLPKELGGLKNLSYLYLSENKLSSLPKELGGLKNLSELYLVFNGLRSLPKEIGGLKNLSVLELGGNGLRSLPKEIGGLKNLSYLYLSENKLSSLPKELGGLKNLSELELSENKLRSLPKELGGLKNLSYLYLSENKLSSLPKELGGLKKLELIQLYNNKFSKTEEEKIKKLMPFIVIFYFKFRSTNPRNQKRPRSQNPQAFFTISNRQSDQ
jgi:Leucine-rich repeat (LRR) protein